VEPVRAVRDDGRSGGNAELKRLKHAAKIGIGALIGNGRWPKFRLTSLGCGVAFLVDRVQVAVPERVAPASASRSGHDPWCAPRTALATAPFLFCSRPTRLLHALQQKHETKKGRVLQQEAQVQGGNVTMLGKDGCK
jgi:hypothetical protein